MDREARKQIVDLADLLHTFGHWTEAQEMELWGRLHDTLRAPRGASAGIPGSRRRCRMLRPSLLKDMYQYIVVDEVTKLVQMTWLPSVQT